MLLLWALHIKDLFCCWQIKLAEINYWRLVYQKTLLFFHLEVMCIYNILRFHRPRVLSCCHQNCLTILALLFGFTMTMCREALLSLVQSRGDHRAKETAKKKEGVKKNYQETSSSPTANTRCGHHGKRRLYSVPEAPDLPDSEAFVDDIISSSAAVSRREDGEEGRREDGDSSDTADVAQSPSFLSPWQPGDVRERKRPQLFGDLGEIGEMRKKRGKGKLRHFSTSSTPSRLHNDITPSTSSPLPLPSPLPNHSPSLNHNSSIASLKTEHSPCSDKGLLLFFLLPYLLTFRSKQLFSFSSSFVFFFFCTFCPLALPSSFLCPHFLSCLKNFFL